MVDLDEYCDSLYQLDFQAKGAEKYKFSGLDFELILIRLDPASNIEDLTACL